mmetsp:Transcript_27369/g.71091  ORF Transcript_27369/g.71091 Transcript_27369/m.71091 type:complete len:1591 (+) Transcript_27369:47-4819(+)
MPPGLSGQRFGPPSRLVARPRSRSPGLRRSYVAPPQCDVSSILGRSQHFSRLGSAGNSLRSEGETSTESSTPNLELNRAALDPAHATMSHFSGPGSQSAVARLEEKVNSYHDTLLENISSVISGVEAETQDAIQAIQQVGNRVDEVENSVRAAVEQQLAEILGRLKGLETTADENTRRIEHVDDRHTSARRQWEEECLGKITKLQKECQRITLVEESCKRCTQRRQKLEHTVEQLVSDHGAAASEVQALSEKQAKLAREFERQGGWGSGDQQGLEELAHHVRDMEARLEDQLSAVHSQVASEFETRIADAIGGLTLGSPERFAAGVSVGEEEDADTLEARLDERLLHFSTVLEDLESSLGVQLEAHEDCLTALEAKITKATGQFSSQYSEAAVNFNRVFSKLEQHDGKLEHLQGDFGRYTSDLRALGVRLDGCSSQLGTELEALRAHIEEVADRVDARPAASQGSDVRRHLDDLQRQLDEMREDGPRRNEFSGSRGASGASLGAEAGLVVMQERVAALEDAIRHVQDTVSEVSKSGRQMQDLKRSVHDADGKLATVQQEMKRLQTELGEVRVAAADCVEKHARSGNQGVLAEQSLRGIVEACDARLDQLCQEFSTHEDAVADLAHRLLELEDKQASTPIQAVSASASASDLAALRNSIVTIDDIQEQIENVLAGKQYVTQAVLSERVDGLRNSAVSRAEMEGLLAKRDTGLRAEDVEQMLREATARMVSAADMAAVQGGLTDLQEQRQADMDDLQSVVEAATSTLGKEVAALKMQLEQKGGDSGGFTEDLQALTDQVAAVEQTADNGLQELRGQLQRMQEQLDATEEAVVGATIGQSDKSSELKEVHEELLKPHVEALEVLQSKHDELLKSHKEVTIAAQRGPVEHAERLQQLEAMPTQVKELESKLHALAENQSGPDEAGSADWKKLGEDLEKLSSRVAALEDELQKQDVGALQRELVALSERTQAVERVAADCQRGPAATGSPTGGSLSEDSLLEVRRAIDQLKDKVSSLPAMAQTLEEMREAVVELQQKTKTLASAAAVIGNSVKVQEHEKSLLEISQALDPLKSLETHPVIEALRKNAGAEVDIENYKVIADLRSSVEQLKVAGTTAQSEAGDESDLGKRIASVEDKFGKDLEGAVAKLQEKIAEIQSGTPPSGADPSGEDEKALAKVGELDTRLSALKTELEERMTSLVEGSRQGGGSTSDVIGAVQNEIKESLQQAQQVAKQVQSMRPEIDAIMERIASINADKVSKEALDDLGKSMVSARRETEGLINSQDKRIKEICEKVTAQIQDMKESVTNFVTVEALERVEERIDGLGGGAGSPANTTSDVDKKLSALSEKHDVMAEVVTNLSKSEEVLRLKETMEAIAQEVATVKQSCPAGLQQLVHQHMLTLKDYGARLELLESLPLSEPGPGFPPFMRGMQGEEDYDDEDDDDEDEDDMGSEAESRGLFGSMKGRLGGMESAGAGKKAVGALGSASSSLEMPLSTTPKGKLAPLKGAKPLLGDLPPLAAPPAASPIGSKTSLRPPSTPGGADESYGDDFDTSVDDKSFSMSRSKPLAAAAADMEQSIEEEMSFESEEGQECILEDD